MTRKDWRVRYTWELGHSFVYFASESEARALAGVGVTKLGYTVLGYPRVERAKRVVLHKRITASGWKFIERLDR